MVISKTGIKIDINNSSHVALGAFEAQTAALDVEHDESGEFVGCGFCFNPSIIYYFSDLALLRSIPISTFRIIAHNGVTDLECLRMWGIKVQDDQLIWDTMLIGHILDSSQKDYSLKGMAKRELAIEYPSYDDIVGKRGLKAERITLDKQPMELVAKYNAIDVYVTYLIYEKQRKYVGAI